MKRKSTLILAVVLVLSVRTILCNANTYELVDLGTLSGYENGYAESINNDAQIVGFVGEMIYDSRAVLFDSNGTGNNIDLGTLPGFNYCEVFSVNDNGQIVGYSYNRYLYYPYYFVQAMLFEPNGNGYDKISLGALPPEYDFSFAEAICDNGQIVGILYNYGSGAAQAVLFDPNGDGYDKITLGTLPDCNYSEAYSINNNGQIVGKSVPEWGQHRATLFDSTGDGNNIYLGSLGGISSQALSINDNGQIVGSAQKGTSEWLGWRATLFDPTGDGNNIDLGTLGGEESGAYSINNKGQIVGQAHDSSGIFRATLFDPTGDGNNIDLNTLVNASAGWTLQQASCINDNGWIVGFAVDSSYDRHAFLLKPILDPIELVKELTQQVITLNLQHGISNSLESKLEAIIKALEDINAHNNVAAINVLEAFINAVEAQRGNKIPEANADNLIAAAQQIIDILSTE